MSKLTQLAEEIRTAEADENKAKTIERQAEAERIVKTLENEFLHTFPDLLEMLKAEGITWRGGMQNENYSHMGKFIEFAFKDRRLKMDFNDRGSYRFEFVPYQGGANFPNYGNSTFGKWPAARFIVWLDEKLVNKVIQS